MYTSMLLVALVGFVPASAEREGPAWRSDYAQAQKEGQKAGKPLAVFVASGAQGYEKVSQEGKLSVEARRLLADNYVCVYLNTDSPEGRRLAASFNIKESTAIVLSDRSGDYQAFNYHGILTDTDLTGCLKRFADPNVVVRNTVTSPYERVSYYPPQANPPAPAAPTYYPPVNYGVLNGGFGGSGGC